MTKTAVLTLRTQNAQKTHELGMRFASLLNPGAILGLKGELGAGKTTFIKGLCAGLGVEEKVVSPTFVLMHLYKGKIPVYHFDLYRLEPKDFVDLGWDEYLEGNGVSVLEWIDRAHGNFPFSFLEIAIEYGEKSDERRFFFTPHGKTTPWLEKLLKELNDKVLFLQDVK